MHKKTNKLFSVVMTIIIVFLLVFPISFLAYAETTQGRITGTGVNVRDNATTSGTTVLTKLNMGTIVTINSKVTGQVAETDCGDVWYNITYGSITGYVYGKYIEEIAETFDPNFENNLKNFPESYHEALRAIHNAYPNWVFKADKVNMSLDAAINLEYSATDVTKTRKYVELKYGLEWQDSRAGDAQTESGWTYASRQAIAFFMDPRNALTVSPEKGSFPNIFTFMELSYDSATQTETGLRAMVAGTFLANGYNGDGDAYIKDIMQAANESKVSPYIIAATILIEQGKGTSGLISGTYPGYEGYYNFFNYGASGDNVVANGLEYAKGKVWNSRRASIIGGAKLYGIGYLSVDQDTYYYMDFNVKYPNRIWQQYATALYDQCTKAQKLISSCIANKNATITFKIPVYTNIPDSVYGAPTIEDYISQVTTDPILTTDGEGDINGDGLLNNEDLICLFQYLSGWDVEVNISALDVNGDSRINNGDLITLFQYLSGWDVKIYLTDNSNAGETFINSNTGFIWPVAGYYTVSSPFGPRYGRNHNGIDISGSGITGRPILAIADGIVSIANYDGYGGGYGNYCAVNHGTITINGSAAQYTAYYAHAASIIVSVGQHVKQGQVLGYVGNTGRSTGPHLHIGILKNGGWVNPYPLLIN